LRERNPDYRFLSENRDAIEELLNLCGWELRHNAQVGVFHLHSDHPSATAQLGFLECVMLLTLQGMYCEMTENAPGSLAKTTARGIFEGMTARGYSKKDTKQQRKDALAALARKRLIKRIDGKSGEPDCTYAILPYAICVVSEEKLRKATEDLKSLEDDDEDDIDPSDDEGSE
jgi:hypothetical protein